MSAFDAPPPDAAANASDAPEAPPAPRAPYIVRRIFAVGDIHGCHAKLARLLDALPLNQDGDQLVFLGDYINRGPDSRLVLDLLLTLAEQRPETVFLQGNHEETLLHYARTGDMDLLPLLRSMGVEATLKSYGDAQPDALRDLSFLPPEHVDFLLRLEPHYRAGGYLFVHAGVNPAGELAPDCPGGESLTVRGMFLACAPGGPEVVVFGHTAFDTPLWAPGKIGIDTGAWQGNLLTAVELPALVFHHA